MDDPETAVLGCVLTTSGACIDDLDLTGEDFSSPKHGDLFDMMVRLWSQGRPVDAFTLSEANPEESAFLFGLTDGAFTAGSAPYYADIVRKHALRRRLATAAAAIGGADRDMEPVELADYARKVVDDAIRDTGHRVRYLADYLPDLVKSMDAEVPFTLTPWPQLNRYIGGLRPGAVYVVAARPGVGKTVVAAQLAATMAEHGHVAFSSMEMSGQELVARIVAEQLVIGVGRIKNARMSPADWDTYAAGQEKLEKLRIAIDDRAGISAADVRAFARSVARKGPLAGVVVDYMQLMTTRQRMERHLQVADFSRQLKILAKDLHVPVVALSQLNRNSEASSLAVPKLSDLRESGAIEQDADVVILLRREGEEPNEQLLMDVAKNRHGQTGEVRLMWDGAHSRALDWD